MALDIYLLGNELQILIAVDSLSYCYVGYTMLLLVEYIVLFKLFLS